MYVLLPFSLAWGEWKFSGSAGPYYQQLLLSTPDGIPNQKSGLTTDLKLEKKFSSQTRFKTELTLRNDALARDQVETFQLMPKSFYLQQKFSSVTARLGYQTLAIDGPDVVNPADVVHPKNWIDPTSPVGMGSPGLSISQESGLWQGEIFYVPHQLGPVLPGEHSAWLPRKKRLPIESENVEMRIPNDVKYKYRPTTEIGDAQANNVTVKIQRKSEKLEAQLLYHNGLNQSPFIVIDAPGTLISTNVFQFGSPIGLRQLYYRQQAVAGTFVIPLTSWVIRGGANWVKPETNDLRVPTETRSGVLGLEKNVETSLGMVSGIFQYVRQENLSKNQISFLRSIFEEALTLGARVPFGEETSMLVGGLYDLEGKSSFSQLTLNHRISPSWSLEAGVKLLQGPEESLLGLYDSYDSYHLRTLFHW